MDTLEDTKQFHKVSINPIQATPALGSGLHYSPQITPDGKLDISKNREIQRNMFKYMHAGGKLLPYQYSK